MRRNLEERSDTELMALALADRFEAFDLLVRRHQQALVNFFRAMGVYNDAEDLAQDTFLRVFRYRERYRPTAKFTTFLFMIARQARIDYLRRAMRRERLKAQLADSTRAEETPATNDRTDAPDTDRILDTLPPAMRAVVVLSFYQGLKYDEIAQALNIPVGTVKSRMFQALRRLRDALDKGELS